MNATDNRHGFKLVDTLSRVSPVNGFRAIVNHYANEWNDLLYDVDTPTDTFEEAFNLVSQFIGRDCYEVHILEYNTTTGITKWKV